MGSSFLSSTLEIFLWIRAQTTQQYVEEFGLLLTSIPSVGHRCGLPSTLQIKKEFVCMVPAEHRHVSHARFAIRKRMLKSVGL